MKYLIGILLPLAMLAYTDDPVYKLDAGAKTFTVNNTGASGGSKTITFNITGTQYLKIWPSPGGFPERGSESVCHAPCAISMDIETLHGDLLINYAIYNSMDVFVRGSTRQLYLPHVQGSCETAPFTFPKPVHGPKNTTECISFSIAGGTDVTPYHRVYLRLFNMRQSTAAVSVNDQAYTVIETNPVLSLSVSGTTATMVTKYPHNFVTSDLIQINGATGVVRGQDGVGRAYWDDIFTVASTPTTTSVTFPVASGHNGQQVLYSTDKDWGVTVSRDFKYADEERFHGGLDGTRQIFEGMVTLPSGVLTAGQNNTLNLRWLGHPDAHGFWPIAANIVQDDIEIDTITVTGSGATHLLAEFHTLSAHNYNDGDTILIRDAPGYRWMFNGYRTIVSHADNTHFKVNWGSDLPGETPGVSPYLVANHVYRPPVSSNPVFVRSPRTYAAKVLIPETSFQYYSPSLTGSGGNAVTGATLWTTPLKDRNDTFPNHRALASCADCHTQSGIDLVLHGFDKRGVYAASNDRGLTLDQGKHIAAFLATNSHYPGPAKGRPWNAPYQPGPGLDSGTSDQWTAGVGDEWATVYDQDLCMALLPGCDPTTGTGGSESLWAPTASMSLRETPKWVRLPHIMKWWPVVSPKDFYSWQGLDFTTMPAYTNYTSWLSLTHNNLAAFQSASYFGPTNSPDTDSLFGMAPNTFATATFRNTYNPENIGGGAGGYYSSPYFAGYEGRFKWWITRCYELQNVLQYQDLAAQVFDDVYGSVDARSAPRQARGWVGHNACRPFSTSPHKDMILAENHGYMQNRPSYNDVAYMSDIASWYEYQGVLQNGNRHTTFNVDIDFNYLQGYNKDNSKFRPNLYTALAVITWLPQNVWGISSLPTATNQDDAFAYIFGQDIDPSTVRGYLAPDTAKAALLQAIANSWLTVANTFTQAQWRTFLGRTVTPTIPYRENQPNTVAAAVAKFLPMMKYYGVDMTTLTALATWMNGVHDQAGHNYITTDLGATCSTVGSPVEYVKCTNYPGDY